MTETTGRTQTFTWRHVLYRLFDAEADLLYIGRTNSMSRRFDRHARKQPWWGEVADCQVEFLPDQETLLASERDAIRSEKPRYNIVHNGAAMAATWIVEDDGWGRPWLDISPRVTAGADHLHEQCRRDYAVNYPEEGYIYTAPCFHCFISVAETLAVVDAAVGHVDDTVAEAETIATHARWVRNVETAKAAPAGLLPSATCSCRNCAT